MMLHSWFNYRYIGSLAAIFALTVSPALAHVSEGGLVLLLPTGFYTTSGITVVILTVLALFLLPDRAAKRILVSCRIGPEDTRLIAGLQSMTRLISLAVLIWLVAEGFLGTRDPLENPLPLMIWTVWFIVLILVQALVGDIWKWMNPFGALSGIMARYGPRPMLSLPERTGTLPTLIGYLVFSCFYLADIAPDDPDRLAIIVLSYCVFTALAMLFFGAESWLRRGEFITVWLTLFSNVALFSRHRDAMHFGLWGHAIVNAPALPVTLSIMIIMIMATGSFDGFNETFIWLGFIGVNPLEFPGRSAVWLPTILGLFLTMILFLVIFSIAVWIGTRIIHEPGTFMEAFGRQARAILPIAAGYHLAHYLTVLLVNGQYVLEFMGHFFHVHGQQHEVTTGFLNTGQSVRIIFLIQAGSVVVGHVIAIIVAHGIAQQMYATRHKVLLSQIPLIAVMLAFTLFGLWLLAAPKGA